MEDKSDKLDRRLNVKDRRASNVMDVVKDALLSNLKWVLTVVIVVTGAWYTIGSQVDTNTKNIIKNTEDIGSMAEKLVRVEKNAIELRGADLMAMQKLEGIESGIKDLKQYVEKMDGRNQVQFDELKKLVYKQAISSSFIQEGDLMGRVASLNSLINKK